MYDPEPYIDVEYISTSDLDRISELLDDVALVHSDVLRSEKEYLYNERVYRWMIEATNRIQELEYKLDKVDREQAEQAKLLAEIITPKK